jgi:hypothetical protein
MAEGPFRVAVTMLLLSFSLLQADKMSSRKRKQMYFFIKEKAFIYDLTYGNSSVKIRILEQILRYYNTKWYAIFAGLTVAGSYFLTLHLAEEQFYYIPFPMSGLLVILGGLLFRDYRSKSRIPGVVDSK